MVKSTGTELHQNENSSTSLVVVVHLYNFLYHLILSKNIPKLAGCYKDVSTAFFTAVGRCAAGGIEGASVGEGSSGIWSRGLLAGGAGAVVTQPLVPPHLLSPMTRFDATFADSISTILQVYFVCSHETVYIYSIGVGNSSAHIKSSVNITT